MPSIESLTSQILQSVLNGLQPSDPTKIEDLPKVGDSQMPDFPNGIIIGYNSNNDYPIVMKSIGGDRKNLEDDVAPLFNDLIDYIRYINIEDLGVAEKLEELLNTLFGSVILMSSGNKKKMKKAATASSTPAPPEIDPETGLPKKRGRGRPARQRSEEELNKPKRGRGRPAKKVQ